MGSNPVFGLNALGGALSVQLKNGFTYHCAEFDALGGSFGKVQGEFQYGEQIGDVATYIAGSALHEGGWRDLQSSDLYNFFGDLGWRGERAELHLNIVAADTALDGPGTSPVELLAADPRAQFTAPNLVANKYGPASLNGSYEGDRRLDRPGRRPDEAQRRRGYRGRKPARTAPQGARGIG